MEAIWQFQTKIQIESFCGKKKNLRLSKVKDITSRDNLLTKQNFQNYLILELISTLSTSTICLLLLLLLLLQSPDVPCRRPVPLAAPAWRRTAVGPTVWMRGSGEDRQTRVMILLSGGTGVDWQRVASYIRHEDFLRPPPPPSCVTLRVPPWILKRGGLESSGRIPSS